MMGRSTDVRGGYLTSHLPLELRKSEDWGTPNQFNRVETGRNSFGQRRVPSKV